MDVRQNTRGFSVLAASLAVLQCAFFYFNATSQILSITGIILSVGFFCTAIVFLLTESQSVLHLLRYTYFGQLALFALWSVGDEFSAGSPILELSLTVFHLAILLLILASSFKARSSRILLLTIPLLAIFSLTELILHTTANDDTNALFETREWKKLERVNHEIDLRRRETLSLKGLQDDESFAERVWLRTGTNESAELQHPSDRFARIAITKTGSGDPFNIQLNLSELAVRENEAYVVRFRARADQNRKMYVGFARSHDPWDGLGLYSRINLTPEWQDFERVFVSTGDEPNGRIHFDLGEDSVSVEISSIRIALSSKEKTSPSANDPASYRWDSIGCRGPNYKQSKPPEVIRLMVMGDDHTFGTGIEENDTFTSLLERRFNKEKPMQSYEVINCGMSGQTIRQSRIFFETYGRKYEADLVLFVITLRSAVEQVEQQWRTGSPSMIVSYLRRSTQPEMKPKFTHLIEELQLLERAVDQQNSSFALVLFRDDSDYSGSTVRGQSWNTLTRIVSLSLPPSRVPMLDIGRSIYGRHSEKELTQSSIPLPNQFAHQLSANAIFDFLKKHQRMR